MMAIAQIQSHPLETVTPFRQCGPATALMGLALMLFLAGCQSSRNYSAVNDSVLEEMEASIETSRQQSQDFADRAPTPASVMESLVPGISLDLVDTEEVEERFDFSVPDGMPIREFFSLLTAGTDYSIAVHPEVRGEVSALDLKNVTITEALQQISDLYDFNINRNGSIFQVLPGGMETRMFYVNYLNVTRNGNSNMQITSTTIPPSNTLGGGLGGLGGIGGIGGGLGGIGGGLGGIGGGLGGIGGGLGGLGGMGALNLNTGGANITTTNEADYWEGLEDTIASILGESAGPVNATAGDARSVVVSPHTGMVVVRAYPRELEQIAEFLAASQSVLQRQVVLEAKILEVELKEGFQAGIDLNAIGRVNSGNTELEFDMAFAADSINAVGTPGALTVNATDFEGVIRLLETQGNVQVISSPRIATLNNQKAVFKVGEEEYFLTSTNTLSYGAGTDQTTNQNTTLQPFFSGIALDVTPQISSEGDIILHIHPILSQVQENIKVINEQELPLANSSTRESDSVARARNGEVIVISGLMQTRARGADAAVPGVRDIPIAGNLFQQRQNETVKTELVILLRALVDEDDLMQGLINEHADSINRLRDRAQGR